MRLLPEQVLRLKTWAFGGQLARERDGHASRPFDAMAKIEESPISFRRKLTENRVSELFNRSLYPINSKGFENFLPSGREIRRHKNRGGAEIATMADMLPAEFHML